MCIAVESQAVNTNYRGKIWFDIRKGTCRNISDKEGLSKITIFNIFPVKQTGLRQVETTSRAQERAWKRD